ncbi:MAG: phosphatidate cytidylyltransferase [Pseudohongiellaceae bacterium]
MLKQRVITAVFMLLLFTAGATLLTPFYFGLCITLVILLAAWEWSRFLETTSYKARSSFTIAVAAACAGIFILFGLTPGKADMDNTGTLLILILGCLFWLFSLYFLTHFKQPAQPAELTESIQPAQAAQPTHTSASKQIWNRPSGIIALGLFALLPTLAGLLQLKFLMSGGWLVIGLIVQVAAVDVGAYFVGNRFGRRKLAPQLSPNKSWEGVWGGFALCMLITGLAVAVLLLRGQILQPVTIVLLLASAPLVSCFSVIGDLLESMLKRNAQLKDSGTLLPGHGGLLDRVDGLLAATPPATLLLMFTLESGGIQ